VKITNEKFAGTVLHFPDPPPGIELLNPKDYTIYVKPKFKWTNVVGADRYRISLFDVTNKKKLFLLSPIRNYIEFPKDCEPLQFGNGYHINIEALCDGRSSNSSHYFSLISKEQNLILENLRRDIFRNPTDIDRYYALLDFYMEYELTEEASNVCSAILKINPNDRNAKRWMHKLNVLVAYENRLSIPFEIIFLNYPGHSDENGVE
jgi:hypothetical protein